MYWLLMDDSSIMYSPLLYSVQERHISYFLVPYFWFEIFLFVLDLFFFIIGTPVYKN